MLRYRCQRSKSTGRLPGGILRQFGIYAVAFPHAAGDGVIQLTTEAIAAIGVLVMPSAS